MEVLENFPVEQFQLKYWNVIWGHPSFGTIPWNHRQVSCAGSKLKGNLGSIRSFSLQQALGGSFSGAGDLRHSGSCLKVQQCSRTEQAWVNTKLSSVSHKIFFYYCICNQNKKTWFLNLSICLESVIVCFRPSVWIDISLANKAFISCCF